MRKFVVIFFYLTTEQVWFSNKRAKHRRQAKTSDIKTAKQGNIQIPEQQQFSQHAQIITVPQHSQIIHPSALPIIQGQFALAPNQLLNLENCKMTHSDLKVPEQSTQTQLVADEASHEANYQISNSSSTQSEDSMTSVSSVTSRPVNETLLYPPDSQVVASRLKEPEKPEKLPKSPEPSKSRAISKFNPQSLYILQSDLGEKPTYVAYVVPRKELHSDL